MERIRATNCPGYTVFADGIGPTVYPVEYVENKGNTPEGAYGSVGLGYDLAAIEEYRAELESARNSGLIGLCRPKAPRSLEDPEGGAILLLIAPVLPTLCTQGHARAAT